MLYETITKILNKGKDEGVDLFVARDMLLVGVDEAEAKDINAASEILNTYYTAITTLRRDGKEAEVETLCGMIEADDKEVIKVFLEELEIEL